MPTALSILAAMAFLYYGLCAILYSPRSSLLFFWPLLGVALIFLALFRGFLFWLIFLPFLLFWLSFFAFMIFAGKRPGRNETPPQALILLGVRRDGTLPENIEKNRLSLALTLLKKYPSIPCILTGGRVFGEDDAESISLKKALCRRGIDPSRLILERESRTTKENFLFSFSRIPRNVRNCAVVTSRYHLFRASLTALSSSPPCQLSFYGASAPAFFLPHLFIREFFTFAVDFFKGNISIIHSKR